jgi:hypothetical protein
VRALRNVVTGLSTVGELFEYLWARKIWWLMPFVTVLLIVALLLLVGEVTGIAPFIYTLF